MPLKGNVEVFVTQRIVVSGLEGDTPEDLIFKALHDPRVTGREVVKYEVAYDYEDGLTATNYDTYHDEDFLDLLHEERVRDRAPVFSLSDYTETT